MYQQAHFYHVTFSTTQIAYFIISELAGHPFRGWPARLRGHKGAQSTTCRVSEASATELGTQNAPGKAPVRAQRRIIK